MSSVSGESSRDESITMFTDRSADGAEVLEAAVVWRHPQPPAPRPSAFAIALALLRLPWLMLSLRFKRRRRHRPSSSWHPPNGWTGSWSGDGERAVLFHAGRRLVRVAGEEHALPPPSRTLVLLVDQPLAGIDGTSPPITVRRHELTVAPHAQEGGRSAGSPAREQYGEMRRTLDGFRGALLADPTVREFRRAGASGEPRGE